MLERILLKYFIRHDYPVLAPKNTVAHALSAMEVWKVKHLPVVKKEKYVALATEVNLSQYASSVPISETLNPADRSPYVDESSQIFEVLRIMSQHKISVLPIVTEKGHYKGVITQESVFYAIADLLPFNGDVSLLVIEMPKRDQNLSALVHLVENNNARVLCYTTQILTDGDNILAYMVIDLTDPSPVMMSLERFNYKLVYHSSKQGLRDRHTSNRWEELMHYMNI